MWLLRYQSFTGKSCLLLVYTSIADSVHNLKSGSSPPRVPLSRAGEMHPCRDAQLLRAQLGHRLEPGSLEAAEKWTEELQSVSLPCLMPLQVPPKTGKASETERGRKTEASASKKEALKTEPWKNADGWLRACVCRSPQLVLLGGFWFPYSNFCDILRKSNGCLCWKWGAGPFLVWHGARKFSNWEGQLVAPPPKNSLFINSHLEQSKTVV